MGAEMSGLSGLGPGDEGQAYTEGRQDWLSTFHLRLPQPDGPVKEALAGDVDAIRARLDEGLGVGELHEWAGMPRVGWRVPLLLAAAEAGHVALVDLLLERGADPNQGWVVAALSQGYIDDCSSLPEVLRDDYDELWRITNGFWNAESEEEQPIYLGRAGSMFEVPALRSVFTDKTVVQIYTFLLYPLKPLDEVDDAPTDSAKKCDHYRDQVVGIAQGRLMVGGVLKP
jgi:hypothetical protein